MNAQKQQQLHETYEDFMSLMLDDKPLEFMDKVVAHNLMGYGTTVDEKVWNIEQLKNIVIAQRNPGEGISIKFEKTPVFQNLSPGEDAALFVDEVKVFISAAGEMNLLHVRVSSMFYYFKDAWKLVHWHASEAVKTENDTFHLNEWKHKTEMLQKLVDEKTAELAQKYRQDKIDAALDRLRAEIASMRTPNDLERITPLVWRELITLGVPFFRCGVFIIKEAEQLVHAYLSKPDGKPLGVLHLPFDGPTTTRLTIEHWKQQKVYTEHWDKEQFKEWVSSMMEQHQISEAKQYQSGDAPPDELCLQFIPFKQGMIYVGSSKPLSDEQINLTQSLADAFAVAYARFEDFKQLEEAKAKVERALAELRATQNQLIQSEKMASLGELTAGIAHEIQNPLNFVNNFSEVSKELIVEMLEEVQKGNFDEVNFIANDIVGNLTKINHHGKRADAIVKGMLQHSRHSNGIKELTDINRMADEYFRLAYQGWRAKEKAFNATLHTDYDAALHTDESGRGAVNIIAQDVGRVLLNLFNNAFYAVAEKRKKSKENYEPIVSLSTKLKGNKVMIWVKDNGSGIPQKILDKIYQPFFTTKPTGEGTGLGLSLSFDIIKAHGGEMKVETKFNAPPFGEDSGTTFQIILPKKS